jgi:NAD-dependent SIR2 family protein deacetylase
MFNNFYSLAGISTACGIPDFRSGMDTVLETGPGCWELAANKGKKVAATKKKKVKTTMASAYPSKTHMSFVHMIEAGLMKFLISQNVDGLHRRSGVPADKISELHGNTNIEKCKDCGKCYLRDSRVRNAQKVHDHRTGRHWDDQDCQGDLEDSIINFGEGLPEDDLDAAFNHGSCADLCLCMGSSLRVTPAADIPKATFDNGGKLVIVNLQKTPLDAYAALSIYGKCDDVMERLMTKLNIEIPKWKLIRYCEVIRKDDGVYVNGRDEVHDYYSLFPQVDLQIGKSIASKKTSKKEPHHFKIADDEFGMLKIKLYFQGHYKEKTWTIDFDLAETQMQLYKLVYDPFEGVWESVTPMY